MIYLEQRIQNILPARDCLDIYNFINIILLSNGPERHLNRLCRFSFHPDNQVVALDSTITSETKALTGFDSCPVYLQLGLSVAPVLYYKRRINNRRIFTCI